MNSRISRTTILPLDVFTQRNFVAEFIRLKLNFIKNHPLSHLLGDLGVTVEVGIFAKGCANLSANFRQNGRRPPTTVGVRKVEWLPFRVVLKYPQYIIWFRHKAHVWQTDGRTDGQRDQRRDSQDRASTAVSRGKNGYRYVNTLPRLVRRNARRSICCSIQPICDPCTLLLTATSGRLW